jgi:hypothetical protein
MRRLRLAYTAAALGFAATLGVVATGGIAQAQDAGVKLFKLITAKDEIVVGITDAEMKSFGAAPDLENLAQHLAVAGQITVWRYTVKHDKDGNLVQAPARRVAIFKADTLRIESFNPAPLKVMPPDSATKP